MHVVAFAPAFRAMEAKNGGVETDGFPMTSAHVDAFPKQITVPMVLALYTEGGTDYDPRVYIMANTPDGERLAVLECTWHWPDKPGAPVKFWVLTRHLSFVAQSGGVHSIGLYDRLDATEPIHLFPLPVARLNPLLPPRP
jgi:hypothetical protein